MNEDQKSYKGKFVIPNLSEEYEPKEIDVSYGFECTRIAIGMIFAKIVLAAETIFDICKIHLKKKYDYIALPCMS